jgi:myo-inositol catabolism protein IolC
VARNSDKVTGFIGFAVGRTVFWGPLADWLAKKMTREAAVAEIARRYWKLVSILEKGLHFTKATGQS